MAETKKPAAKSAAVKKTATSKTATAKKTTTKKANVKKKTTSGDAKENVIHYIIIFYNKNIYAIIIVFLY